MSEWRLAGEASLDELLDDDIMRRVMLRAGLDAAELRRRLSEIARRRQDCGDALGSGRWGTALG